MEEKNSYSTTDFRSNPYVDTDDFVVEEEEDVHLPSFNHVVSAEDYCRILMSAAFVHKAEILFDDRPSEIAIRVSYIDNMSKLPMATLQEGMNSLDSAMSEFFIENTKNLAITYYQKEVISWGTQPSPSSDNI